MKTNEEIIGEFINKFVDHEGCQTDSEECGKKKNGKFICPHCQKWNGPEGEPKLFKQPKAHSMEILAFIKEFLELKEDQMKEAVRKERERIAKGVKGLVYCHKGAITGGPYTDHKMRGPNVEKYELINRYDVFKVIYERTNEYDFSEENNPVVGPQRTRN